MGVTVGNFDLPGNEWTNKGEVYEIMSYHDIFLHNIENMTFV